MTNKHVIETAARRTRDVDMTPVEEDARVAENQAWDAGAADRAAVAEDPTPDEILDALLAFAPADVNINAVKTKRQAAKAARARLKAPPV